MKKTFLLLSLITVFYRAQQITCMYKLMYKANPDKPALTSENFYLDILGEESAFRSERERASDSLIQRTGLGLGRNPVFNSQLYTLKNLKTRDIQKIIFTNFFNDKYSITIDEKLEWKILPDKQKVAGLDCQKATVSYGGRSWTAWFTQSIPVPEGPYVFNGLPGMIVNISDNKSDYSFNLIKMKEFEKDNLFAVKKAKAVNWEVFQKIQSDYYTDPFAEIKARNMKVQAGDEKGNLIPTDLNKITKQLKKQIKENNNPIELNHRVNYD
ncbi:GLPGLI family protein [uncultured Chryseobacterium sp.]|uniref:GLPGLI family protein n=1 Tax=uncultured Chryseobacterium sp. TaxID=259322 RepID=UPI0025D6C104|nr:GLPGLI family protein [uncultured Chryseobacterium sp.]